jgi:hypothetical protein
MSDKPKRKHAPYLHRRLHTLLLVWIVMMFLATCYPPLWLMPPYLYMTPSPYIILSLGWIPVVSWHVWHHGGRRLTLMLIIGCIIGNIFLTSFMFKRISYRCETSITSSEFFCDYYEIDSSSPDAIRHHYRGRFLHLGLGLALLLQEEHTANVYDASRR